MRYLIDTCVISEIVKRIPERKVLDWVRSRDEGSLHLSVLTIGEIQKGISKLRDARKAKHLQKWIDEDLRKRFAGRILGISLEVAFRWGVISGSAERDGRKIPVIDGLLAATALESGLTIVTRNVDHLRGTGAAVLNPWESSS